MLKKLKNKKGFTMVELIVVLVILAILAALLVPALTGYIDKANQEKVIAECRSVVMAAQTTASEYYGLGKASELTGSNNQDAIDQINKLAEVPMTTNGSGETATTTPKWFYKITIGTVNGENNVVKSVVFDDGTSMVTYTKGTDGEGSYSTVSKHKDNGTEGTDKVSSSSIVAG